MMEQLLERLYPENQEVSGEKIQKLLRSLGRNLKAVNAIHCQFLETNFYLSLKGKQKFLNPLNRER
jgi:hypothetical protein